MRDPVGCYNTILYLCYFFLQTWQCHVSKRQLVCEQRVFAQEQKTERSGGSRANATEMRDFTRECGYHTRTSHISLTDHASAFLPVLLFPALVSLIATWNIIYILFYVTIFVMTRTMKHGSKHMAPQTRGQAARTLQLHAISLSNPPKNLIVLPTMLCWLLFIMPLALLPCLSEARHSTMLTSHVISELLRNRPVVLPSQSLATTLRIRAGSDSEGSDSETGDEQDGSAISRSRSSDGILGTYMDAALQMAKTVMRTFAAVFDVSQMEEDASAFEHVVQAAKRALTVVFYSIFSPSSSQSTQTRRKRSESDQDVESTASPGKLDFGSYLGSEYGVDPGRDVMDEVEPILTGSFQDALKQARSQARLLVVLIPAYASKKNDKSDVLAVESFLSQEVATVARRKAKKGSTTGSFVLWSTKAASPEAALAIKRLKAQTANAKGKKRAILLAVYPNQILDNSGRVKMVPRLLAQHHCSPPPSAETMAAWLNALRKRHAKQYTTMQTELREFELFRERKEGYKDSVKADIENKKREEREEAERKAKEEAEKKRTEELRQRRLTLEENLPDEPDKNDTTTKTVALRLPDGRTSQRRFPGDTPLETVFGWVDVTFEIEQETVALTTMNGKLSFSWEDREVTLEESGLPKMAGLRVTVKKDKEDDEKVKSDSD